MSDIEVTITLPETLVKEAEAMGMLSSKHIEMLLRADIQTQLIMMTDDPDVRRENEEIQAAFEVTEVDGIDSV